MSFSRNTLIYQQLHHYIPFDKPNVPCNLLYLKEAIDDFKVKIEEYTKEIEKEKYFQTVVKTLDDIRDCQETIDGYDELIADYKYSIMALQLLLQIYKEDTSVYNEETKEYYEIASLPEWRCG
jgi:hypothetical protein